ncbi:MAG: hypothetical protein ABIX01_10245 [Chitinophagaceae bacterium]
MKKRSILNESLAIALFAILLLFSSNTEAQDSRLPRPNFSELEKWYEVGTWTYDNKGSIWLNIKTRNNPPQTHRVFVCRYYDKFAHELGAYNLMGVGYSTPQGQEEHIEIYAPGAADIKKVTAMAVYLLNDDGTYSGPSMADVEKPAERDHAPIVKPNISNTAADAGCNFTTLPDMNSNARYSETLAKSGIYGLYGFEVNTGGLSSPLAIGVSFLSIQSASPFTNTVSLVPGRGAQRKHDAAPAGATLYPFHTKYIVCKKYTNAVVRTQYENDYVLFKANNGNWQCGGNGIPQIEYLK